MEEEGHGKATSEAHQASCCDICGDVGVRDAIVTCIGCGAHEHLYCMRIVKYEYPETWYCDDCKSANEIISPISGNTEEIVKESTANMRKKLPNDSKQIVLDLKPKISTGKTKFLSAEEVIGLNSGAKARVSPIKIVHSSPVMGKKATTACKSTTVKSNNIPSISSRQLIKPSTPSVHPPSQHPKPPMTRSTPLSFKRLRGTNVNDVPSENLMNGHNEATLTASVRLEKEKYVPKVAAASVMPCQEIVISGTLASDFPSEGLMHDHNQATSTNRTLKARDIHQTPCMDQLGKEQPKDVQGDTMQITSQKGKCPQEIVAASVMRSPEIDISGRDTFRDLEIERTTTSVNSFVDPSSEASWNGIFKVPTASEVGDISDEIQAHPPCRVRKKVYAFSKMMPEVLQFELVPRMDLWGDLSQHLYLDKRDIGLYLFPTDIERWEQYLKLLKHMEAKDLVMRTIVDSLELLVFPSTLLNTDCQEWNRRRFLWGVFKKIKPCCAIPLNAIEYFDVNNDDVDMDIDMIGGIDIGTTEIDVMNELFRATSPDMTEDMEIDQIGGEAVGKTDIVIPREFISVATVALMPDIPPGYENARQLM